MNRRDEALLSEMAEPHYDCNTTPIDSYRIDQGQVDAYLNLVNRLRDGLKAAGFMEEDSLTTLICTFFEYAE